MGSDPTKTGVVLLRRQAIPRPPGGFMALGVDPDGVLQLRGRTGDAESVGSGGEADPATFSRLAVHMSGTSLTARPGDGSSVPYPFSAVDEVVGADIEVDGNDNTKINILTDGVYALSAYVGLTGDGPIKYAAFTLIVGLALAIEGPADGYETWYTTIGWTSFLPAGTVISLTGIVETVNGSDTWTLWGTGSSVRVQRIA